MNGLTLFFRSALCILCIVFFPLLNGCTAPQPLPQKYKAVQRPDPRVPLGQPVIPTIGEGEVRQWLDTVKFANFRFNSLSNEFHPDDGNLLATYKNGPKRMLYLSYVDNVRMSRYAFPRSAKEIVSVGNGSEAEVFGRNGWTWFGASSPMPILAVDITPNVKIVLVGYAGVSLEELAEIASGLPLDSLARFAATGPRSKL